MRLSILIFCLISFSKSFSQGILNNIPDSLQKNANEIILYDHTKFEIIDIANSKESQEYKVIIVNDDTDDRTSIQIGYDQFTSITDASVVVTNLEGEELESYKLKDFEDYSQKGGSLASDNRSKYLEPKFATPYVLEVKYELAHIGSLFYPTWIPLSAENQSLLSSTLSITSSRDNYRYKSFGVKDPIQQDENTLVWEVSNLKAIESESYAPQYYNFLPVVYTAPNQFMMDGYEGNMSTWKGFGEWQNKLIQGLNNLSEEDLRDLKGKIPQDASDLDKIRIVYEYVQANTRYVSIQLGIGGWKPFESQFVHEKKYGDCKALSFYTRSLLEAVGIKSYYTLINAGYSKRQPFEDFPASYFNHAIVTVPMQKDTIWLECTSQTNPFGYLGTFTSDRNALMITEDGGKLIHTKSYTSEENIQSTSTVVEINEEGTASVNLSRSYYGLEIGNDKFSGAVLKSEDDQKKWFYDYHSWGSTKLSKLELTKPSSDPVPKGTMVLEATIEHFASNNANRLFHNPFTFTNIKWMDMKSKERELDLEIKYAYTQLDTTLIKLPAKYAPENLPKEASISNKFGSFSLKVNPSADGIQLIREFKINEGIYTTEEYGEFRDFIRSVQKSDRQKIVMVDKT